MEKIAILTTSDIQGLTLDGDAVKSTGVLENLLENDYKIYVISTRVSFGDHDLWWLKLLGDSEHKVFQPKRQVYGADDIDMISLWARIYEIVNRRSKIYKIQTWFDLRDDLSDQGILTGPSLYKYKRQLKSE